MKKILVVEDDTFLANAYRVKLTKAGFEVRNAFDGDEALDLLESFTPDVILLDIVMPKKDGFATLTEIKSNEKWKNIPIILASNLGQKEDRERGMQLGASEFFVKTDFTLNDLLKKIDGMIKTEDGVQKTEDR